MRTAEQLLKEVEDRNDLWRVEKGAMLEFFRSIQLEAYKAGMTAAATIVDEARGEEGDLRCVRDRIKSKRDSITTLPTTKQA